jgi:membrane-associated phospholipid phosphatase
VFDVTVLAVKDVMLRQQGSMVVTEPSASVAVADSQRTFSYRLLLLQAYGSLIIASMSSGGRRFFLRQVGGLVGAGALSHADVRRPSLPVTTARAENALLLRQIAAEVESQRPLASAATNGDEALYPNLIGTYGKGFLHSQLGEVNVADYQTMIHAISTQQHSDFTNILLGYGRKLVNIESSFTYDLEGGDPHTFPIPVPPAFSSAQAAAEMVELYWQALARDVPFAQFASSSIVQSAAAELNTLSGYQGPRDANGQVTTANVFRGPFAGCLVGPYVSQYMLQTIYFGSTPREQMYRTGVIGADYMTDYSEWLELVSGLPPFRTEVFNPIFLYIRSGRELAQFVHYDYTYQNFLQASLIILNQYPETILDLNLYQLNNTNPYGSAFPAAARIQTGFTTFGSAHVIDWVARAANLALKATCYFKWAVHRRVRPEEFGGRVYNNVMGLANYPIHSDLMNSKALKAAIQANGNALLPQAYVEGCPLHPSYPAGHAAIAGACATVLKALFEETDLVSGTVDSSADGLSLVPYTDAALTLGGEINKLAYNHIMGRIWAGIHYRSDADAGLALGEAVAICFLQDQVNTFTETFPGFAFTKFDGTPVSIAPLSGPYSGLNLLTPPGS